MDVRNLPKIASLCKPDHADNHGKDSHYRHSIDFNQDDNDLPNQRFLSEHVSYFVTQQSCP
jgi:hypothetical protein